MGWREAVAALLGVSAYTAAPSSALTLDSPQVENIRRSMGGQIASQPVSQTRWYPSDLESAEACADRGDLAMAARLMRSARKDGVLAGVLSTRTAGLVRLPKRFRGTEEVRAELEIGGEDDETRSVFDEMFPAAELALLAADGELIGVGVGEMLRVPGRDHPVFCRLDPEFLRFRWNENRWYYLTLAGPVAITPGDGRWILHTPGGRLAPWNHGLWRAIGRAYIRKEHAALHKENWESKLANPARVAISPNGASEEHKQSWFRRVMAWGVNTVFGLTPGYDVKLLESNGRGWESFNATIADQNNEFVICVAGQTVTTDGGTGFANADIHKSIRADLIKATADALAHTINTQGIPPWLVARWGEDALSQMSVVVEWDVTPPADRKKEADALVSFGQALATITTALAAHGLTPDVEAMCVRAGIPTKKVQQLAAAANDKPKLELVRDAA